MAEDSNSRSLQESAAQEVEISPTAQVEEPSVEENQEISFPAQSEEPPAEDHEIAHTPLHPLEDLEDSGIISPTVQHPVEENQEIFLAVQAEEPLPEEISCASCNEEPPPTEHVEEPPSAEVTYKISPIAHVEEPQFLPTPAGEISPTTCAEEPPAGEISPTTCAEEPPAGEISPTTCADEPPAGEISPTTCAEEPPAGEISPTTCAEEPPAGEISPTTCAEEPPAGEISPTTCADEILPTTCAEEPPAEEISPTTEPPAEEISPTTEPPAGEILPTTCADEISPTTCAKEPPAGEISPTTCAEEPPAKEISPTTCADEPPAGEISPTTCAEEPPAGEISPTTCAEEPPAGEISPTTCAEEPPAGEISPTTCAEEPPAGEISPTTCAEEPPAGEISPTTCAEEPPAGEISPTTCADEISPTTCAEEPPAEEISPTTCAEEPPAGEISPTTCAEEPPAKEISPTTCADEILPTTCAEEPRAGEISPTTCAEELPAEQISPTTEISPSTCTQKPPAEEIVSPTAQVEEIQVEPHQQTTAGDLSSLEPGDFLERLKCSCSTPVPNTCPVQYKLNLSHGSTCGKLARYFIDYGSKESLIATKDIKVLIVVGARAVGKTTLINGLANYIYGIQWDHDFRLKVIDSIGYAPTNKITAYTFPWVDGMKIDHSLTVIDTPGLGGLAGDKVIFSDIKNLLGTDELVQIHGVLFVAQASCPQSSELQYVSETVLSFLGKDLKKENIFLMATFSDGRKPIILKHLRDFPYGHYFKFNNSALYGNKFVEHESGSDSDESDEEEEEEASLTRLSWKIGAKSFEKFLLKLQQVKAYNLDQTREVINTRKQLQDSVQELPEKITRGLKLIGMLKEQENKSSAFDSEILASKDYVIKVNMKSNLKVDISGQGRLVTNCLDCNMTCHFDCDLATEDKYKCSVMVPEEGDIRKKYCSVCPRHCGWRRHVNNPYIFEEHEEEVENVSEELCTRYGEAIKKKTEAEQDIFLTRRELKTLSDEVRGLIKEVKGALQLLQDIALESINASEVDYINLLIEQERSSGRKGLLQRIKVLERFRKQAQLIAKLPSLDHLEETDSDSQSIFEQLH